MNKVLERPGDDNARLVCSDYLEQHCDQPEYAEFIRVQVELVGMDNEQCAYDCVHFKGSKDCDNCKRAEALRKRERELLSHDNLIRWLGHIGDAEPRTNFNPNTVGDYGWRVGATLVGAKFERGFISEVRAPLACLIGGECGDCVGVGSYYANEDPELRPEHDYTRPCSRCNDGTTPGIAARLVREQPVQIWRAVDKVPDTIDGDSRCWLAESPRIPNGAAVLPSAVFELLEGGRMESGDIFEGDHFIVEEFWRIYESEAQANAALSDAINKLAREAVAELAVA